jgi:ectoine hydroxylase-related dioxygenase (phytanoyl-CoA dioxygenase family)
MTAAHRSRPAVDRATYLDQGWARIRGVFDEHEAQHIADTVTRVAGREMLANPAQRFTVDASEDGVLAPRKIDYAFQKDEEIRRFALDERLRAVVSEALGDTGYLIRDSVFLKPPRFGSAKPYHQENASLGLAPADGMLVAWVALDSATEDNGCLSVVPGSHRSLTEHLPLAGAAYHHVPVDRAAIRSEQQISLTCRPGDVLLLHSQIMHASEPNRSATWRRAYSAHWVTDGLTCTTDALHNGYSTTVGGDNDFLYRCH